MTPIDRKQQARQRQSEKKVIAVGASASIVIPLRLQVTAENLTQIEVLERAIAHQLLTRYGRFSSNRIELENKHHAKIHAATIDE